MCVFFCIPAYMCVRAWVRASVSFVNVFVFVRECVCVFTCVCCVHVCGLCCANVCVVSVVCVCVLHQLSTGFAS